MLVTIGEVGLSGSGYTVQPCSPSGKFAPKVMPPIVSCIAGKKVHFIHLSAAIRATI